MRNISIFSIAIILIINIGILNGNSQIQVNTTFSPSQFVLNNFIGGSMGISNVIYQGIYSSTGVSQFGEFSNINTNLGISQGIILATGDIYNIPNTSGYFMSTDLSGGGCTEISNIAGNTSFDAAVLEFDFIPYENTLNFNYAFASEEYHSYVMSSYNDAFGFFVSGPNPAGGNYIDSNIALLPGTSLPVSINNVNNGYTGNACSSGPCNNCTYFVDNCNDTNIVFNGFTFKLFARCDVIPNQTYHIKIAVADVGDGSLDSGVFLEAGSFASFTTISENSTSSFKVYPNPVNENLFIDNINKYMDATASILDLQGRIIIDKIIISSSPFSINTSDFEAGMYFVKISDRSGTTLLKIMKE